MIRKTSAPLQPLRVVTGTGQPLSVKGNVPILRTHVQRVFGEMARNVGVVARSIVAKTNVQGRWSYPLELAVTIIKLVGKVFILWAIPIDTTMYARKANTFSAPLVLHITMNAFASRSKGTTAPSANPKRKEKSGCLLDNCGDCLLPSRAWNGQSKDWWVETMRNRFRAFRGCWILLVAVLRLLFSLFSFYHNRSFSLIFRTNGNVCSECLLHCIWSSSSSLKQLLMRHCWSI